MMNSDFAFSVLTARAMVAPSVTVVTKSSRNGIGGTGENKSASSTTSPKSCWTCGKVKSQLR